MTRRQVARSGWRPSMGSGFPRKIGRIPRFYALLVSLLTLGTVACSTTSGDTTCSDGSLLPIIATVVDVSTGVDVCNAVVTATLNGTTQTLSGGGSDGGCAYKLSAGAGGNYTVSATAPGYGTTTSAVVVDADSCGRVTATRTVTLELTPES